MDGNKPSHKIERMEYITPSGGVMYIGKKAYEKLMKLKNINITGMRYENDVTGEKLVVDYDIPCKKSILKMNKGTATFYNIGERPEKPKPKTKSKK